jgi:hypothetical protein
MNSKKGKMIKLVALSTAILLGVAGVLFALDATGTIFISFFELGPGGANTDGTGEAGITNIRGSADPGPDWADLFSPSSGPDRAVFNPSSGFNGEGTFLSDDVSAGGLTDRTVYAGGPGDKNNDIVQDWTWATSSVPAKDDISNGYVWTRTVTGPPVPLPGGGTTDQHKLIFVGVEREDPSGDSHVDIEFFQAAVRLDRTPPCPKQCFFLGTNTNNDLLVNMDFTNGGNIGSVVVRRRQAGVRDNYVVADSVGGEGCSADLNECAFNNGASILNGGWNSFDNHAAVITTLATNSFTEFGIDVTALGFGNPCFSTVEIKTRSSQSFTASLKDFAVKPFQNCFATVATRIHAGNRATTLDADHVNNTPDIEGTSIPVGSTIHDLAIVTGQTGVGNPVPTGTVVFRRFPNADCSGATFTDESVQLTTISAATASTGGVAAAESSNFSPPAGSLSYRATYLGDNNYTSPTTPSTCEVLTVNKLDSKVITDVLDSLNRSVLNTFVRNGTTIHDEATVFGLPLGGTTLEPTGQVEFRLFTTANCTGAFTTETGAVVDDGVPNNGIGKASSQPRTPNDPAGSFLCYKAQYLGDANYNPSPLSDAAEPICAFTPVPKPTP